MFIQALNSAGSAQNSSLPAGKLATAAVDSIKSMATEDSDIGTVGGGNRGLSAYLLSPKAGRSILAVAKDLYPGSKTLKAYKHNPASTNLVAVLTSEDEPRVHLFPQSKTTGSLGGEVTSINVNDLLDVDGDVFQEAFPGASQDYDWTGAMSSFFGKEKHLDLGPGSAKHLWWK